MHSICLLHLNFFYYSFIYTHLYVYVDTHLFKNVSLVHLSQDNINSQGREYLMQTTSYAFYIHEFQQPLSY